MVDLDKAVEKAKSENGVKGFAERVRGKKVVVYGTSWAGKTTLITKATKHLGTVLWLDADQNYPVSEVVGDNVIVRTVRSYDEAIDVIENFNGDTVVVDSLSSLTAEIFQRVGAGNPRATLLSSQSQERLIKTAMDRFETVIIITHVGADFQTGGERIRINQALLRYIDVLVKIQYLNKGGGKGIRKVTIMERKVEENPEFVF